MEPTGCFNAVDNVHRDESAMPKKLGVSTTISNSIYKNAMSTMAINSLKGSRGVSDSF
jgi:predicted HAD superfamily hydrolase